jgi:hypothetical protein
MGGLRRVSREACGACHGKSFGSVGAIKERSG